MNQSTVRYLRSSFPTQCSLGQAPTANHQPFTQYSIISMNYSNITPCVTPTGGGLNMLSKGMPLQMTFFRTCDLCSPWRALVAKVNQEFFQDVGGCGQIWQNPPSSKAIPNSFCFMRFGSILRSSFFFLGGGSQHCLICAHALHCDIQSYDVFDFSNFREYFRVSGWWNTCSTVLQVALILRNSYLYLVVRLRMNWSKMAGIASIHILTWNVCLVEMRESFRP